MTSKSKRHFQAVGAIEDVYTQSAAICLVLGSILFIASGIVFTLFYLLTYGANDFAILKFAAVGLVLVMVGMAILFLDVCSRRVSVLRRHKRITEGNNTFVPAAEIQKHIESREGRAEEVRWEIRNN